MLSQLLAAELVALVSLLGLPEVNPPSTVGSWSIEVSANPLSFSKTQLHQRIPWKLTNVSNKVLWVIDSSSLHDYDLTIADSTGKIVPMTSHGQALRDGQNEILTRLMRPLLSSKESLNAEIDLRNFYDLAIGSYMAHISLKAFTEEDFDARERHNQAPGKPAADLKITINN